jgi:hypothetical protein
MEQPFEFVTFGTLGATGHTFGCDCCTDDVHIPDLEVITELDRTATMYRRLSRASLWPQPCPDSPPALEADRGDQASLRCSRKARRQPWHRRHLW